MPPPAIAATPATCTHPSPHASSACAHAGTTCPAGSTNCADPATHREMCAAPTPGYSARLSLNRKCCPPTHACGPTYDSLCTLTLTSNATLTTPPQFLAAPAVFAGCRDGAKISPAAAGGVVACAIVAFVALCWAALWCVRRRLYRAPRRRSADDGAKGRGGGGKGGVGGVGKGVVMEGIVVTSEIQVEEGGEVHGEGEGEGHRDGGAGEEDVDKEEVWMRWARQGAEVGGRRGRTPVPLAREEGGGGGPRRMPRLLYRDRDYVA
ncbi:hypothetical protein EDC01DRAFT_791878 [Geopyxis carbonaria]|nr:hypothetical protein EDC01DRAFT_791878 [Geopyxis carbonaria]